MNIQTKQPMRIERASSFKREAPLDIPPGNLFARTLTAKVVAHVLRVNLADVVARMWPNDRNLAEVVKQSVAPATTFTAGWAAELAQRMVADVTEALGASSGAVELLDLSLKLAWDGAGSIAVPGFVSSASNASFVAEGDPIPVRQLAAVPAVISPKKVASIAVLTREMIESSNAEALITDTLIKSAGLAIDSAFFDAAAATAARPAGIRNGIAALPASNNADAFAAFAEDLSDLVGAVGVVGGKGPFALIGNAGRVTSISVRYIDEARDILTIISPSVGADLIVVAPKAIAAAFSADPDIETANAGTLVMDTAPAAAGTMGPERSLFQTDSIAVKIRWPFSWAVRDPRGVAWITPSWK